MKTKHKPSYGLHKPRVPRWLPSNTIALAIDGAAKPKRQDIASVIHPIQAAVQAMRQGVATAADWGIVAGSLELAVAIEKQGIVRGLAEHFKAFDAAMQAIHDRCSIHGGWQCTSMYFYELDALRDFVHLHAYQLNQLSRSEIEAALIIAQANVKCNGGVVRVARELAGVVA